MHSHFVLHLDHDDRMLAAIHFAHMPHQGRKGAGIGVAVRIAQGREEFHGLARVSLGSREALEIPLHPVGRVTGQTVLPACEPQKYETQIVTPRTLDHSIQDSEVELPFLMFDLVPGNARQDGVDFGLNDPRP